MKNIKENIYNENKGPLTPLSWPSAHNIYILTSNYVFTAHFLAGAFPQTPFAS